MTRLGRLQQAQHVWVLKARREQPCWLQRAMCNPAMPTQCSHIQLGAVASLAASPAEPAASIWQPVQRASARPPARIPPPPNGWICRTSSLAHTMHEGQSMDEEEVRARSFCRWLSILVSHWIFFSHQVDCARRESLVKGPRWRWRGTLSVGEHDPGRFGFRRAQDGLISTMSARETADAGSEPR